MLVTGVDIETTGLDFRSGHKIIEIAFSMYDLNTQKKVDELAMRFNPRRNIDAKAQAVHKISLDMLAGCPLFEDEGQELIDRFVSKAGLLVAHNGESFDIPFMKYELAQYGIRMPDVPLIDTMLDGLWACEDGKRPRLEELAFSLGFVYDHSKSHGALYDTDLMMQCFFRAREKYNLFPLPVSLSAAAAA